MYTDNWEVYTQVSPAVRHILLAGPPGIGKSYIGLGSGDTSSTKKNKTVLQVTLNEDLSAQELFGHYVPEGAVFAWHDGPLTEAFRNGFRVVINEIGRASGAVQNSLLGLLDSCEVAKLTLPNGETVTVHKDFRVVATMNGDPDSLDPALLDRFDVVLTMTAPHPQLVQHLNQRARNLGTVVNDSFRDVARAISPRRALTFMSLMDGGVPRDVAGRAAFGDRWKDIDVVLRASRVAA